MTGSPPSTASDAAGGSVVDRDAVVEATGPPPTGVESVAGPSEAGAEPATLGAADPDGLAPAHAPASSATASIATDCRRTVERRHRSHSFQVQAHGAWIDDSDFATAPAAQPVTLTRTAGELSPLMPSFDGVEKTARYSVAPPCDWAST